MTENTFHGNWSRWLKFPDPRFGGYLNAPFGPGVYQLRNTNTNELVLFGRGKNLAYRMSSLLPNPLGGGTRKNEEKKEYVFRNLKDIEYRTKACSTKEDAVSEERLLRSKYIYVFST